MHVKADQIAVEEQIPPGRGASGLDLGIGNCPSSETNERKAVLIELVSRSASRNGLDSQKDTDSQDSADRN
jgi:hypothetical protein